MAESSIGPLETSLRLLQAQQLAGRGGLREAMAVVALGGLPPAEPELLHALAALATGAGDYRMALPLWRLLVERDPENAYARRMVAAIELWQARPPWMQWFWPAAITAGVAALAGVLLWLI